MNPSSISRSLACLALPAVVFIVPLLPAPHSLAGPAPWLGFLTWWIVLRTQPTASLRNLTRDRRDRLSALGIAVAVAAGQLTAVVDLAYGSARGSGAAFGVGAVMIAFGLALRLWAIRTLGRFFTATVQVQRGQAVITSGPYRLVRHPSYSGALLVAVGVAVAHASAIGGLATAVLGLAAYAYRIGLKEKTLARELGLPYEVYRGRSWRLVPYGF